MSVTADYLGGSGNDIATGVAVDAAHVIYVTGVTLSTDFPVAGVAANYPNSLQCGTDGNCNGGKDDSFVTAIAFAGVTPAYVYSHYLGGSAFDDANQIVVDSTSNAYVVGITSSTDFPHHCGCLQNDAGRQCIERIRDKAQRGRYDAGLLHLRGRQRHGQCAERRP